MMASRHVLQLASPSKFRPTQSDTYAIRNDYSTEQKPASPIANTHTVGAQPTSNSTAKNITTDIMEMSSNIATEQCSPSAVAEPMPRTSTRTHVAEGVKIFDPMEGGTKVQPRWQGGHATVQRGHGRRQESVEEGVLLERGQFFETVSSMGENTIFPLFFVRVLVVEL